MREKEGVEMELMDVKEASEYLRIKEPTLYKYLREGIIPAFKVGNFWRLEKTALNEWIKGKMQEKQSVHPRAGHTGKNLSFDTG